MVPLIWWTFIKNYHCYFWNEIVYLFLKYQFKSSTLKIWIIFLKLWYYTEMAEAWWKVANLWLLLRRPGAHTTFQSIRGSAGLPSALGAQLWKGMGNPAYLWISKCFDIYTYTCKMYFETWKLIEKSTCIWEFC